MQLSCLEEVIDKGEIVTSYFLFVIEDDPMEIVDNSKHFLQSIFVMCYALPINYVLLTQSNSHG